MGMRYPPPGGWESQLAVALSDIRGVLRDILAEIRAMVPRGVHYSHEVTLTNAAQPYKVTFQPPLFSLTIINDGPVGSFTYRVPSTAELSTMRANENETITCAQGRITDASFLLAAAGVNAALRLKGLY